MGPLFGKSQLIKTADCSVCKRRVTRVPFVAVSILENRLVLGGLPQIVVLFIGSLTE